METNVLYKHLINNNILSPHQYGFVSGRSSVTQLLSTIHDWLYNIDNNILTDAIYMNFKETFDTVPHVRLLRKLEGYGVKGEILNWVKAFLENRQQFVKINNSSSKNLPVTSGVPQGSVLGPTLFIYFINDLPLVTNLTTKIFADDTKLFTSISDEEDHTKLQESFDKMYDWTKKWLLKFNEKKCRVLHIGRNNKKFKYYIDEESNRTELEITDLEKDLGVNIDPLLTFKCHIKITVKKATAVSFKIIRNILTFCNENRLRGHKFKIIKLQTNKQQFSNYFSNRVINNWNGLPSSIVNADSINKFKKTI